MKVVCIAVVLIFLCGPLSGCLSDDIPEKTYIDEDSELDLLEADFCGDLDGDGELDCPLSGYVPETTPWWCNSSGIGGHHVDPAYDGMTKEPLSNSDCETLTGEFQEAIEWASQWPTLGDAEDAGFHMLVGYTEGMGTHHARLGDFNMSNELFDFNDPEFIGTAIDADFDYSQPEFLMYSGEDQDSELVGFAWYVQAPTDSPPAGFTGDNDWWHRHDSLCFQVDVMIVMDKMWRCTSFGCLMRG
jgi:hypothetical protein